jgi:hypothetical protein
MGNIGEDYPPLMIAGAMLHHVQQQFIFETIIFMR